MATTGEQFVKMSGSGNDFIFIDARRRSASEFEGAARISALCARGTGVGADGVVFVEPASASQSTFRIRYLNRDGSRAALCGNATLCAVRWAAEEALGEGADFLLETDAGPVRGRMRDGVPEIDLQPIADLRADGGPEPRPDERRIGYAVAGVPHAVVACGDLHAIDLISRGRELRFHPAFPGGANVNFVTRDGSSWAMRTYERGVEGETLACGTGAVAAAAVLRAWGAIGDAVDLRTSSGRILGVRLRETTRGLIPSLRGEGRIVFRGTLAEV